jgi:hypothetical protein
MIIVMNVLGSEVNSRGEPRNWLCFYLLPNNRLLAIIDNPSTLRVNVIQSKRDRWISLESCVFVFSTPEAYFFLVDVDFEFQCFHCSSVLFEVFSDTRSWTYKAYFSIAQEVPFIVPVDTEYRFRRPESSDTSPSPSVVGML